MLEMRTEGTGPTLVLIDGLLMDAAMFDPLVPLLRESRRVVVPTLRGHGGDTRPPTSSVEENALEVLAALEAVSPGAFDLLGYSQGGAVAQAIAVRAPERVRHLVLCCTFAFNGATVRERFELALMPLLVRLLGVDRLSRWLPGSAPELTDAQREAMATMIRRGRTDAARGALEALRTFDGRPFLRAIACPTLLISGGRDTAVPRHHADQLREGIAGARLEVFDDATHTLAWTHASQLAAATLAFTSEPNGADGGGP